MKNLYVFLFLFFTSSLLSHAVQVDGYCYLDSQNNHSGTKILFQADSPSAVTDSVFTDSMGYYQIDVTIGVYDIYFSHEGYREEEMLNELIFESTTFNDIILEEMIYYISGQLSGIFDGSTYIVVGDISIDYNDSLVIEPGASFLFGGDFRFNIYGYLNASGNEQDSIRFIPNEIDSTWNGIYFWDEASDSSLIKYCFFSGSHARGVYCISASPSVYNSTFIDNIINGGVGGSNTNMIISDCLITGNSDYVVVIGNAQTLCSATIINCVITENSGFYAIRTTGNNIIKNCSILNNNSHGINSDGSDLIENCKIENNNLHGIYLDNGESPNIINCIINNNQGSGIYCFTASANIINCTITGNANRGIYCRNSSMIVLNTIVEGNSGNGGIYFENSTNVQITYSDFYRNENGNFTGIPPQWLGQIVMTNTNGDSCDAFYNIFEDPLFVSSTNDDYHLQEGSPCIDAGDPNSPFDPDSTIADMGAFYFDQNASPIYVTLTPFNPPILIPANGGTFEFNIGVGNTGTSQVLVDIWTMVTLPNGSEYGPIINFQDFNLQPGTNPNRDRDQNVPMNAPTGEYTYDAYIGEYPDSIYAEDHFDFEKLSVSNLGVLIQSWENWGEDFSDVSVSNTPENYALHAPYPNPFNPETTLTFDLPAPGKICLKIYNIRGEEVVSLIDETLKAGSHNKVWNAENLPSGIYFARLTSQNASSIQKLLLLK